MQEFKNMPLTRDIARELARKYSTMTYDELDVLECSFLSNMVREKRFFKRVRCVETFHI